MSKNLRLFLTIVLALWSQRLLLAAEVPQGVLLITVDSLRADYLSCNGSSKVKTPNIDRLASGGVNFSRARAPVPLTLPAHASIHTASYPPTHGVRSNLTERLRDGGTTLAGILGNKGYRSIAAVASFLLDHRFGLDQGFEVYDDRVWNEIEDQEQVTGERTASEMLGAFRTWLGLVDRHQRFFFWLHFNDPHYPYDPPEPFRSRYADDLYAGEVAYVDAVVGDLVSELERRGRIDSTLVALVGDHGEGLGDHDEEMHSLTIYNEIVHVPLIVQSKGQIAPGTVVNALVRTIDIAPTILDLLAIDSPIGEGASLVRLFSPDTNAEAAEGLDAYSESLFGSTRLGWAPVFGLERGDYRLIDSLPIDSSPPALFRAVEDPHEMRNVVDDRPEIAEALRARLGEIVDFRETGLRSPSLAVWSQIETGIQNLYQGEPAAALELLTPILDQDPSVPLVYELIGRSWLEQGEVAKAQRIFMLALERGIETGVIRRELGKIYLDGSDLDSGDLAPSDLDSGDLTPIDLAAAESNLRRAVELNELDARARLYLAESLSRLGRHDEATSVFRQAIELNNTYLAAWTGLAQTLLDSGQPREALAAYRRALDVDPGNPTISAAIEQITESSQPPSPRSDR